HLLTGWVPFPGENHLEVTQKKDLGRFKPAGNRVSAAAPLDPILAKLMARDPRERFQTASDLIVALERTGLAAPVPSYGKLELALRDPRLRARLTAQTQPTQPDLQLQPPPPSAPSDGWFLRYQGRDGRWHLKTATTPQVLRCLQSGKMPRGVQASRPSCRQFRPLLAYPEFRAHLRRRLADTSAEVQ